MRRNRSSLDKLVDKIEFTESCWLWRGTLTDHGYGRVVRPGRSKYAHRVAYEDIVGPIPDGLVIDHLCRVHACVNPDHLEPVTSRVNSLRGETLAARQAAQTHCIKGHPFEGANLVIGTRGARICRTCRTEAAKERAARERRGEVEIRVHGTYTSYGYGCRCWRCRRANADYRREYRARKGAAT